MPKTDPTIEQIAEQAWRDMPGVTGDEDTKVIASALRAFREGIAEMLYGFGDAIEVGGDNARDTAYTNGRKTAMYSAAAAVRQYGESR